MHLNVRPTDYNTLEGKRMCEWWWRRWRISSSKLSANDGGTVAQLENISVDMYGVAAGEYLRRLSCTNRLSKRKPGRRSYGCIKVRIQLHWLGASCVGDLATWASHIAYSSWSSNNNWLRLRSSVGWPICSTKTKTGDQVFRVASPRAWTVFQRQLNRLTAVMFKKKLKLYLLYYS